MIVYARLHSYLLRDLASACATEAITTLPSRAQLIKRALQQQEALELISHPLTSQQLVVSMDG